ncbi:MAG: hypothetical protein ACLFNV_08460 [Desulfovibrionales bacterium]
MTTAPRKVLLFWLLGLLVWGGWSDLVHAASEQVARATAQARDAGVDEASLNRILALGVDHGYGPKETRSILDLLQVAAEEGIPARPFVAKVEEGVRKRVPLQRILPALSKKLDEYRFIQGFIRERIRPRGGAFGPDHLVTLAETLDMGLGRDQLREFLKHAPQAAPAMLVQGAESFALLHQAGFSEQGARRIVYTGLEQETFTPQWRLFPVLAGRALGQGMDETAIVAAVTRVLHQGGSPRDVAEALGLTWRDLQAGS